MKEIWKDIPGYPNYQASSFGNIRSLKFESEKLLSPAAHIRGYLCVSLRVNGFSKGKKVHSLVALAFVNNPNNYKEVNHINSNKTDNIPENLEWCNRSQNMKHMIASVGPGHRIGMTNPKATIVVHKELGIFCTMREAAFMSGLKEANFNNMMYETGYRKNKTKFIFT